MNHPKIIFSLLKQLGTDFTPVFVKNFFKLQDQPLSSKSICDLLDMYDIETMTVQFTADQLKEVTYPVLALTETEKSKEYMVLNELKADQIKYTNERGKVIWESVEDFEKQWTGVAILIDAQNQKPEPGYKRNKKSEKKRKENWQTFYHGCLAFSFQGFLPVCCLLIPLRFQFRCCF